MKNKIWQHTKMKNQLIFSLLLFCFILSACSESTKDESTDYLIEAANDPETIKANEQAIRELKAQQKEDKLSSTSMKIDKEIHDFGTLVFESENQCVFKITNTGDKPLIIDNVKASCGCTTPEKPEGAILPGKSHNMEVGFKPNTMGDVEKTVTITANTEPKITVLKIKANVIKK